MYGTDRKSGVADIENILTVAAGKKQFFPINKV
jgi:hypothetical protein